MQYNADHVLYQGAALCVVLVHISFGCWIISLEGSVLGRVKPGRAQ